MACVNFSNYRRTALLGVLALGLVGSYAQAADFQSGNIVVVRIGDNGAGGNITGTVNGSQTYLDEFSAVDGSLVQTVTVTGVVNTSAQAYDSQMTRSENRHFLIVPGFLGAVGAATGTMHRTIAVIDKHGAIVSLPDLAGGTYFRGATSPDGVNLYAANGSGVFYTTASATGGAALTTLNTNNNRIVQATFGGLYIGHDSSTNTRPFKIATGYPTSGTFSPTAMTGMPAASGSYIYSFGLCHTNGDYTSTPDTIYLAQNGGISKWCWDTGQNKWIQYGSVLTPGPVTTWGVAVSRPTSTGPVTIYFTAGGALGGNPIVANTLYKIVDTTGFATDFSAMPATLVATAATGTRFTGVAFAPDTPTLAEVVSFSGKANGNNVTVSWNTQSEIDNIGFNLYRATTPNGQWTKVNAFMIPAQGGQFSTATYSYNDIIQAGQTMYYRLEDIDSRGVSTYQAPIAVTAGGVQAPAAPKPAPVGPRGPRNVLAM